MNTNTFIVKCPHCGALKKLGFSINPMMGDYVIWSDCRIEGDGWIEPADTQLCPECGKYFILPRRDTLKIKKVECSETGRLSYQSLKKAIIQLYGDDESESRARYEVWCAFNAQYKIDSEAPAEEQEYNRANMQWLIDYYSTHSTRFSHILFELNRLMGNQEVCEQMIEALTFEEYVRQTKAYHEDNKLKDYITSDRELMEHRYINEIKELRFAMEQPLKPYIKI